MYGLDTNILMRFITRDDEEQWQRVDFVIKSHAGDAGSMYISDSVLCEMAWVLRSYYGYNKSERIAALEMISEIEEFKFSNRTILKQAIELYKNGKADFADYFIVLQNKQAGCEYTYSFDKTLLKESLAVPIPN
jgi:predicted nucleic-acid-binding protein